MRKSVRPSFEEARRQRENDDSQALADGYAGDLDVDKVERDAIARGRAQISEGEAWEWACKHDASTVAGL